MSTPLEAIIKDHIRDNGHMTIAEYMALCLGHPEHGYYMTRDPFGKAGDFTTAPEISQMLGEMIGAWLADTWIKMGSPAKVALIECGAGRGTLMSDALRATKGVKGFHDAIELHLLETSPVLRQAQKDALKGYGAEWHTEPESIRVDSPVLIIGNEFLDALPARQLVYRDTGWFEKVIKIDKNDTIRLYEIEANKEVNSLIPPFLIPPKIGDHLEVSLEQKCFLTEIMKIVLKQGGSILMLDYGFNQSVCGDTLQAVKDHSYCDVLESPGEADITTHVRFSEISRLGMEKNMTVHGPVSQANFLKRLGIETRASNLSQGADAGQRVNIAAALSRLIGENTKVGEMGSLFKAIALSSDPNIDLAGF